MPGRSSPDGRLPTPSASGRSARGDWASTVPGELQLTGRYGVRLGETLDEARASFEAAVARAAADEPALADHPPQVTWWGAEFASASTSEDAAIVGALRAAGAPPDLTAAPYGSDLRLVLGMAGLPAVQFGPGRPDDAHTDDESVRWSEVVACARTIALAAARLMALGSPVDNPAASRAAPGTLPSCRRPMI